MVEGDIRPHVIKFLEDMSAFYKNQGTESPTIDMLVGELKKTYTMSHPANEEFLEREQENFASADSPDERGMVVARLRDNGFTKQADYLAKFVETGFVDELEESRIQEAE